MRITTWNVNGLRAAIRKGFEQHLAEINPDVLLLQEVRAFQKQLPLETFTSAGWTIVWNPAQKAGYSGTAIWSRVPFTINGTGFSPETADDEGRIVEIQIGQLAIACIYLPSGSSGEHRQKIKDRFLVQMDRWAISRLPAEPFIFGGDLNVAHTEADIFYAKANEQTSGFLPHEREWFGRLLKSGWHDLVRETQGSVQGPYTWWSNRGRARELDRGWRIDYLLCNPAARPFVTKTVVHRQAALEVSDHAPVSIDIDLPSIANAV